MILSPKLLLGTKRSVPASQRYMWFMIITKLPKWSIKVIFLGKSIFALCDQIRTSIAISFSQAPQN